jgi:hypothetical protein
MFVAMSAVGPTATVNAIRPWAGRGGAVGVGVGATTATLEVGPADAVTVGVAAGVELEAGADGVAAEAHLASMNAATAHSNSERGSFI